MPTIYRRPKKEEKRVYHTKDSSLIHQYVYNTDRWRKLRIVKLGEQPTCECPECVVNGVLRLALDVHHRVPISTAGENINAIQALGFDYNNLMSVSPECHRIIHQKLNEILEW